MTDTPKPTGRPPSTPWASHVSRLAGLPTDRAAWIAQVLPVLLAASSLADADRTLSLPRATAQRWYRWLREQQLEDALPEHVEALPERAKGFTPDSKPRRAPLTPERVRALSEAGVAARQRKRDETAAKSKRRKPVRRAK